MPEILPGADIDGIWRTDTDQVTAVPPIAEAVIDDDPPLPAGVRVFRDDRGDGGKPNQLNADGTVAAKRRDLGSVLNKAVMPLPPEPLDPVDLTPNG